MEKFIRYFLMSFVLLLLLSCRKDDLWKGNKAALLVNDHSLLSGAVMGIQVTGMSERAIEFSLDVAVFRDSKNVEDGLKAENFSIDSLNPLSSRYCFRVLKADFIHGGAVAPYSALMLMDQSGSIRNTDPENYRLDAAKALCSNLGQGDHAMLWSFTETNLQPYGTCFTADGNSLLPGIEDLRGKQAGATPLYRSQYTVINYTAANAPSTNKAVLTFTDGEDTEGGFTYRDVANHALSKNVQLYNIGLSSAHVQVLSEQSIATGGAFMFAQDARQLISMFGNLGKLLDKSVHYYHTTWSVSGCRGSFNTGALVSAVRITLPNKRGHINIPFSVPY